MSELPKGWVESTISEITSYVQRGKGPKYSEEVNSFPVINQKAIRWFGIQEEHLKYVKPDTWASYTEERFVRSGDILWNSTGTGTIGRACLLNDKEAAKAKVVDSHVTILRVNSAVEPRYLFYWIRSPKIQFDIESLSTGTTNQVELSKTKVLETKIPLAPLNEQKRIADKLDSILAKVDRAQARLDKIPGILKRFRQAVLAAATSGELTREWRALNTGFSPILRNIQERKIAWAKENAQHNEAKRVLKRAQEYPKHKPKLKIALPDTWGWESLEDCVLMIVDCHNKTAPYIQSGIPLIRTSNIRDGKFIWQDLRFVDDKTYAFWSKRCIPEQGDIIFTREAPMGEAAIIPQDKKVCLGQRTMLLRPIEPLISAKYLLITIMDPGFKSRSDSVAVGTGVKHYRVGDVSNLAVPVPSVEEQAEIVRRVEKLFAYADQIEQYAQAAVRRVNNTTQTILERAFRGELVDQNQNDESAEQLIERIRKSRLSAKSKKK